MKDASLRERIERNPFHVLGLPTTCTRLEMEREAQKLLGQLELGLEEVQTYATPLGPRARNPELVREAVAELRDPRRRLLHELLADVETARPPVAESPAPPAWTGALSAFGYGPGGGRS